MKNIVPTTSQQKTATRNLIKAVEAGNLRLVCRSLDLGADPNARASDRTPLLMKFGKRSYACFAIAAVLIEAGADVNRRWSGNVRFLHVAAGFDQVALINLALRHGAEINAVDAAGRTALHWAAEGGRRSAVERLIKHGADALVTDVEGRMPIHVIGYSTEEIGLDLQFALGLAMAEQGDLSFDPGLARIPPRHKNLPSTTKRANRSK